MIINDNTLLTNKIAIITGAAGGVGRATAVEFSKQGAKLVLTDTDLQGLNATLSCVQQQGGEAVSVKGDVTSSFDCRHIIEIALQFYGGIDILFNNAAIIQRSSVIEMTEEQWDSVLDTNVKSIFLMCKYAIPFMVSNGGGSIINKTSGWGLTGEKSAASYCASKGAVVVLTKAMALDHRVQNVRVNCICPTEMNSNGLSDQIKEIANTVLFLASEMSLSMTGNALMVDGSCLDSGGWE